MRIVVKYGGRAMGAGEDQALLAEVAELRAAGHAVILVHGGGREIDAALARRGLDSPRVDGLRVTDAASLEVVEAVLCGTINKRLVRLCLRVGIPAVGLSGQDGGLVKCRPSRSRSGAELGYVGEVTSVDPQPLLALLGAGYLPVVAPMAIGEELHQAYNVNADTTAAAIAAAVRADAYVALTDVARILRDPSDATTGIERMTLVQAQNFAESSACTDGMKPKILAAIAAVAAGVTAAYVCASRPGAIAGALSGNATIIA